ncbi:30S ribosomal protein S10 (mitochondrion) [Nitzschia inconspicua]|uniref:30S ribosomal protein S10 n=1 Tax=Nitzschia inconspicua TaxID=303405 RepID=A0A8H2SIH5_9STRA|nr:30S ribosomal protein S10 [Nitzschia inconspicua]
MFLYLRISCKDKRVLKKFLRFFIKKKSLPIFLKSFSKHEMRKVVTVLKSPHVNKTAQEQFEYRVYSKSFLIYSCSSPFLFSLVLKRLRNVGFPGLDFKIKGVLSENKIHKYILRTVSPDNITVKTLNSDWLFIQKKKLKKVQYKKNYNFKRSFSKKYLQFFDLHGEICLQKIFKDIYLSLCIFSSVG